MFLTRIVVSERAREEKDDKATPCDSRYDFVSWMMCVSASASFTAALSDSGLRMSDLEIFILSAIDEATASLYVIHYIYQLKGSLRKTLFGERADEHSYTACSN